MGLHLISTTNSQMGSAWSCSLIFQCTDSRRCGCIWTPSKCCGPCRSSATNTTRSRNGDTTYEREIKTEKGQGKIITTDTTREIKTETKVKTELDVERSALKANDYDKFYDNDEKTK